MVQGTPVDWPDFENQPPPWITQRTGELSVTFNDCFYRNMYKYKYIALLDMDEAIVPLGNLTSWSELMQIVELNALKEQKKRVAAYNFQNINFIDEMTTHRLKYTVHDELNDIPTDLHILRNVYRNHRYSLGMTTYSIFHDHMISQIRSWAFPSKSKFCHSLS